jgi:hypothetical protein
MHLFMHGLGPRGDPAVIDAAQKKLSRRLRQKTEKRAEKKREGFCGYSKNLESQPNQAADAAPLARSACRPAITSFSSGADAHTAESQ